MDLDDYRKWQKLHYAIYAKRRALTRERSVIKRTRRHPRATTLPRLTRWLMQFFPRTGILRSTQMIVLHEGQRSETPKEEGIQRERTVRASLIILEARSTSFAKSPFHALKTCCLQRAKLSARYIDRNAIRGVLDKMIHVSMWSPSSRKREIKLYFSLFLRQTFIHYSFPRPFHSARSNTVPRGKRR